MLIIIYIYLLYSYKRSRINRIARNIIKIKRAHAALAGTGIHNARVRIRVDIDRQLQFRIQHELAAVHVAVPAANELIMKKLESCARRRKR
jgi:hypothetical protein